MKLYYAPNTISIASVIALHEAGIAFQPLRLDFAAGEQTLCRLIHGRPPRCAL